MNVEIDFDTRKAEKQLAEFIRKYKEAQQSCMEWERRRGWLYRLLRWIW